MSSRQMKKLQKQQQQQQQIDEETVQQIYQEEMNLKSKNVFNKLIVSDSDEGEQEQDKKEETTKQVEEPQQAQVQKKKKKQKNKKKQQKDVDEDLEFLENQIQQQAQEQSQPDYQDREGPLFIFVKKLNYNKELSHHFKGTKLTGSSGTQQQKLKQKRIKNYVLTYNDENYFPIQDKFELAQTRINDQGLQLYRIEASKSYETLQQEYTGVKNSFNPQAIFDFMQQHPFHAEAIYDVSEYFRLKADYKQANLLLERLIYIYEDAFGYKLKGFYEDPTPRIELELNNYSKTFLMALFKFTDVLGKKGCYKAALEFSKVILKLCPTQDPTGALLLIDYHCLLNYQFDFLLFFTKTFVLEVYKSKKGSLAFMPNYLYNSAIAKFLSEPENQREKELNYSQKDFDDAIVNFGQFPLDANHRVLLIQAILLYPSALLNLSTACEFTKQNVPNHKSFVENQRKPLKDLLAEAFLQRETYLYWFLSLESEEDQLGLKKILEIFPERCKITWKQPDVLQWIKGALGLIVNNIQKEFDLNSFYENLAVAPQEIYNEIPFQFRRYKELLKNHFSDQSERLDVNNIFAENIGAGQEQQQMPQNFNPLQANQGLLGALLGTLLPWVHNPNAQQ